MKNKLIIVTLFTTIAGITIAGWVAGRKLHYALAYEEMVRETVREMVREEALK